MLPEEVMDFHIGLDLLVDAAVLHRSVLPIKLAFFSATGGDSSLYRARGTSA